MLKATKIEEFPRKRRRVEPGRRSTRNQVAERKAVAAEVKKKVIVHHVKAVEKAAARNKVGNGYYESTNSPTKECCAPAQFE